MSAPPHALGRYKKVDDCGFQGIAAPPASTSMAGGSGWFGRGAAIRGWELPDFRFGGPFRASRRSRQGWLRQTIGSLPGPEGTLGR